MPIMHVVDAVVNAATMGKSQDNARRKPRHARNKPNMVSAAVAAAVATTVLAAPVLCSPSPIPAPIIIFIDS